MSDVITRTGLTYDQLEQIAWQRDNFSSARAAEISIDLFAHYEPFDVEEALSNALSDIRHACDLLGISFEKIDNEAHRKYIQYKTDHGIAKINVD